MDYFLPIWSPVKILTQALYCNYCNLNRSATTHYWKSKFSCGLETVRDIGKNRQGNYFVTVNRHTNPDRDKMAEKLQDRKISLAEFPCVVAHKKIRICRVKKIH